MAVFTGAGVAIATPFDENYNIDYESFGKFIDFQIENKTDAIIVCGTSGEASTLSHEEHIAAIRYCVNRVNKRVPVIAGTGSVLPYCSKELLQALRLPLHSAPAL